MRNQQAEPAVPEGRQAPDRTTGRRIVGGVALAYTASMVIQNVVFGVSGAPAYSDPLDVVLAYHAAHRDAVAVAAGLEALHIPLLLLFLTGLHGLVQRGGGAGAQWSRLAVAAGATFSTLSALVIATHITVVLTADGMTEPTPAFALIWRLHAAILALALPALGATFIGAALAAHASGLTRSWQRVLGLAAGSLAIVAGVASLAVTDGSPVLFAGVAGLAAWPVWLLATGLRLIRSESRS